MQVPGQRGQALTQVEGELSKESLQFRRLGLGLLEDGDVGVGVFPQCKEVLKGFFSFHRVARERGGARQAQVGK